jgi:hypothetical protein
MSREAVAQPALRLSGVSPHQSSHKAYATKPDASAFPHRSSHKARATKPDARTFPTPAPTDPHTARGTHTNYGYRGWQGKTHAVGI